MIKIESQDGVEMEVSRDVLKRCDVLANMLDAINCEITGAVPISEVDSATMKRVIAYTEDELKNCPEPFEENKENPAKKVTELLSWEEQHITNLDNKVLYDLTMASNFLGQLRLLDACSKYIAKECRGKSPSEIRKRWGVPEPEPSSTTSNSTSTCASGSNSNSASNSNSTSNSNSKKNPNSNDDDDDMNEKKEKEENSMSDSTESESDSNKDEELD